MSSFFRFTSAERTDSTNAYFFHQHQRVYSFCLEYVRGKDVLEVGSGSGYGASRLAKAARKVLAIDNDEGSIRECRKQYHLKNLQFVHDDFVTLRINKLMKSVIPEKSGIQGEWIPDQVRDDKKYDVIICLQFIEHVKDANFVLKKMHSLLKPGGVVILSTPNSLTQSYNENPYHFKEYTPDELKKLVEKHFRTVEILGLFGDKTVQGLEESRRQQVKKVFRLDPIGLRRIIPRRLRQVLFDLASSSRRRSFSPEITEANFLIKKQDLNHSIDLIAVCKK